MSLSRAGCVCAAVVLTVAALLGAPGLSAAEPGFPTSTEAAAANRVPVGSGTGLVFLRGAPVPSIEVAWFCTLTAIGYDAAGELVGITNAHCVYDTDGKQYPGDAVLLQPPGVPWGNLDLDTGIVGRIAYISGGNPIVPGPNGVGLDYAVIVFDQTKIMPTSTVDGMTVTSIGPVPPAGTILCKQGRKTGRTCGAMLGTQGPYFTNTIAEDFGDSGAPVVADNTLVGVLWSIGAGTAFTEILADLDRRGGPGAGFRLATP